MTEQQVAFWDTIRIFEEEGLLPHVMLIGSWAEYIYQLHMESDFIANLKTRDVDFLYPNIYRPKGVDIRISEKMKEKGFIYTESRVTGVGKYIKGDLLELEFLTRVLGEGQQVNKIPALNIKAAGIREINMLANYPLTIDCKNFAINVPEPEAYMLQKLLINPKRKPENKKEKDIQAVRELMPYVSIERLKFIFNEMSLKEQNIIDTVRKEHFIDF